MKVQDTIQLKGLVIPESNKSCVGKEKGKEKGEKKGGKERETDISLPYQLT